MHGNHPPLCFARLALLGIHGMKGGHVYQGAQEVLEYYRSRNMIPTDDKVFSRSSDSQVLKILFLDRPPPLLPNASTIARNLSPNASSNTSGSSMIVANQPLSFNEDDPELQWMKRINLSLPAQFKGRPIFPSTRQILNQASVTDECNAHNWSSVLPLHGKWKGVECRSYITKDLLHDMSAMQEVDVLISLHSSGEMNGLFMRKDTQKIQLRPKELGTTFRYYARYWVELCERSQFPFQCFFVNFEDDDSWEPGIHERLGYPSMADIATRRDRHLWLDFASLVKVMREILPIQGNRDEYFKRWQRCHVTYNVWGKGNITYGSHRSIDSAKVVRDGVTYNSDGFDMATNQCPR